MVLVGKSGGLVACGRTFGEDVLARRIALGFSVSLVSLFGGKGGSLVASYAGALIVYKGVEELVVTLVPVLVETRESDDLADTADAVESEDNLRDVL